MGIRFACHVCGKRLNIKRELAGRRGVCPSCSSRFRIPTEDSETSIAIDTQVAAASAATAGVATSSSSSATLASPALADPEPSAPIASATAPIIDPVSPEPNSTPSGVPSSDELLDDNEATWYVRPPSGGQYGPATSEILRQWIDEGRVAATALLWRDGWPQWRDASDALPEFAGKLPDGDVVGQRIQAEKRSASSAGNGAESVRQSPAIVDKSPELTGQAGVGADRRNRSTRQVMLIGVLIAVAATLLAVLAIVVNR